MEGAVGSEHPFAIVETRDARELVVLVVVAVNVDTIEEGRDARELLKAAGVACMYLLGGDVMTAESHSLADAENSELVA